VLLFSPLGREPVEVDPLSKDEYILI